MALNETVSDTKGLWPQDELVNMNIMFTQAEMKELVQ